MAYIFEPLATCGVPIAGASDLFPVGRIFCVGRSYAAHAVEMGDRADRKAPFYFTKTPSAVVLSGSAIPYPPGTENYQCEMEFVAAIGGEAFRVTARDAVSIVYGYACGFDMTRRDLQLAAREHSHPWSLGKDFERSAVLAPITRAEEFGEIRDQRIRLQVNGEIRQDQKLSDLMWSIPQIISHLSRYYHLKPGDLIYTGTPAGVPRVFAGDRLTGAVDGLTPISLEILGS